MDNQKGFSWVEAQKDALAIKIRRAKNLSRGNVNPTFDIDHPDWVRDANQKNYTVMIKAITDDHNKKIKEIKDRDEKLYG